MDILLLRYFKKVAESKNMTTASQELMVAQPAISKMIKKLEGEVGYPLFDRKGRNIVLNENGKILLRHTNAIFDSMQSARDEIADHNDSQQRSVKIRLLAGSKLFPDILTGFTKQHPHCQLRVTQGGDDAGDCDISIFASGYPAEQAGQRLLLRERILLVLPRTHHLADQKRIPLSVLEKEHFLSLHKGSRFRQITDFLCEQFHFTPQVTFEFDNPTFLREVLSTGLGVAFMPDISWGPTNTEHTKAVDIASGPFYRYIYISWNTQRYLPHMAELFRDFVIEFYANLERGTGGSPAS